MKVFVLAVLIGLVAAMPQDAAKPPVEIITSESEGPNLDGSYKFKFETADGVKREEEGAQKQIGEEAGATSRGSWSYTAPEGDKIDLTFVADENGFQPQGAHLPVAPEPSPAIKRALAIIARTNAADEARAAGMSTKQKLQMLGLLDQRLGLRK
ncbi:cuticle protein CP14.6 [Daphnia magna]|nr:cuticle protein CP14.6 [Daphnia magna]KAK4019066.1 hypothetical protein OUZ56_001097 [Daphnia magna]